MHFDLTAYLIGCAILFVANFVFMMMHEETFTVGELIATFIASFVPVVNAAFFIYLFFSSFLFGRTMTALYKVKLW